MMTPQKWLRAFLIVIAAFLVLTGGLVAYLDPFFHYHAPLEGWYYELSDQRSQNDGITKHFTYDAVITGTSMAENFRTSEYDALFGTQSVKLPYPGATFKEINDNLKVAFATHDGIRYVLRPLDYSHITEDKDALREDMGEYPSYLYDDNLFNDVKYFYNRDVFTYYLVPMIGRKLRGDAGGVTSFDAYGWTGEDTYSREACLDGITEFGTAEEQEHLSEEELRMIRENMEQNVISLAQEHPETTFQYFFPPYSAAWWGKLKEQGTLLKQIEASRMAAEMMLEECSNIEVYSFNTNTGLVFNLDNYKDTGHYSPDVNSQILQWISSGEYRVTQENLEDYFRQEEDIYLNYDYPQLLEE